MKLLGGLEEEQGRRGGGRRKVCQHCVSSLFDENDLDHAYRLWQKHFRTDSDCSLCLYVILIWNLTTSVNSSIGSKFVLALRPRVDFKQSYV